MCCCWPHTVLSESVWYCETLDRLRKAVHQKKPRHFQKGYCPAQHSPPHMIDLTKGWFQPYYWDVLLLLHSPNLAPSGLHLFGLIKWSLSGMWFHIGTSVSIFVCSHVLWGEYMCFCIDGTSALILIAIKWESSIVVLVTYMQCFLYSNKHWICKCLYITF